MNGMPYRAMRLTLVMDADTRKGLVDALMNLATQIDREEITTGCSGGVDSGSIYELLIDPEQTHDKYFKQVDDYLAEVGKRKKFDENPE